MNENSYIGDVPHPGYFIREELEARGWMQRDLAYILGVPSQAVNLQRTYDMSCVRYPVQIIFY
jgi:plasmid maintenance system antidote protein VapI